MKRFWAFGALLSISVCAFLVFGKTSAFAAIEDRTWTGGQGGQTCDNKLSTAACWGGTAPDPGDNLVFPATIPNVTLINNFPDNTSFNSIKFTGEATSGNGSYTFNEASSVENSNDNGNDISLVAGITSDVTGNRVYQNFNFDITLTASQSISVNGSAYYSFNGSTILGSYNLTVDPSEYSIDFFGVISGTGAIIKNGSGYLNLLGNNTYSGTTTVSSGMLVVSDNGLGAATESTTVSDGASLRIIADNCTGLTIAEPFILAGDGDGTKTYNNYNNFSLGAWCQGGYSEDFELILSGPIALDAATKVNPSRNFKITGPLSGATIGVAQGQSGTLTIASSANASQTANGNYQAPKVTNTVTDSLPDNNVTIGYNETLIINGARGEVYIDAGGILKGTGTIKNVVVANTSSIAPGLSPGCLSTNNLTFEEGGIYDFELGGTTACSGYDQIKVTGTVALGNGTLNLSLYNNFKPAKGQVYTIIDNDGTDAVSGTFKNLAEGATFTVNGYVYKISYKGGDGNDVTVTVQSLPKSANTGVMMLSNPFALAVATTAFAGIMLVLARKTKFNITK